MSQFVSERPLIFHNNSGHKLFGVLHLPEGKGRSPVVIMAHGFTDDKTGDNRLFVKFARFLAPLGVAVFRFDFSGSGDSEGDFEEITPDSEIEDLKSAIDFVRKLPEVDDRSMILIGYSLGGAISICAAAEDQRIKLVIGWAPVSHLGVTFRRILGENTFCLAGGNRKMICRNGDKQFCLQKGFFLDVDNLNPMREIGRISPRPVLLIQGLADEKVLPGETQALYDSAKTPKKIHFIEGSGHSFAFYEKELFEITLQNIKELY